MAISSIVKRFTSSNIDAFPIGSNNQPYTVPNSNRAGTFLNSDTFWMLIFTSSVPSAVIFKSNTCKNSIFLRNINIWACLWNIPEKCGGSLIPCKLFWSKELLLLKQCFNITLTLCLDLVYLWCCIEFSYTHKHCQLRNPKTELDGKKPYYGRCKFAETPHYKSTCKSYASKALWVIFFFHRSNPWRSHLCGRILCILLLCGDKIIKFKLFWNLNLFQARRILTFNVHVNTL